jgi:hypothetical protein
MMLFFFCFREPMTICRRRLADITSIGMLCDRMAVTTDLDIRAGFAPDEIGCCGC